MPYSEARIPIQRADRYLTQLCRHAEAMGERGSQHLRDRSSRDATYPRLRDIQRSDTGAVLRFDQGRCVVRAEPDALVLSADAGEVESLWRIEALIAADLERFGSRDHVTVTWQTEPTADRQGDVPLA